MGCAGGGKTCDVLCGGMGVDGGGMLSPEPGTEPASPPGALRKRSGEQVMRGKGV